MLSTILSISLLVVKIFSKTCTPGYFILFSQYTCIDIFIDELGNVLGVALFQVLRLNIVSFTSLDHMPVVTISPLLLCVATNAVLLGYSVGQPELYHCVVPLENLNESSPPHVSSTSTGSNSVPKEHLPEHCSCGCGSAKKDGRKFCNQVPYGNKSQCKCYNNMVGCSFRCKCVDCGNPYGSPETAKRAYTHLTVPRYLPKQKLQEVKESTSSLDYLIKQGLNPVTGWSEVESLTVDCLVNVATLKGFSIEPLKVHEYYSRLHDILSNLGSPLQPKKVKQIEGKLQCIKKVAKGSQALYKKQVELNWF